MQNYCLIKFQNIKIVRNTKIYPGFLNDLAQCKNTLRHFDIHDNKSINKAVPELINLLKESKETLNYINI